MLATEKKKPGPKPTKELTESQTNLLKAICAFKNSSGYAPTVQELADILEIRGASVQDVIENLIRKGYLKRTPHKARSLEVIKYIAVPSGNLVPLPILGTIAAGIPILAMENICGEILVEASVARGKCFALKVQGDSMIDAGIAGGDLVIVRQQPIAESGDIVAALINDEATVKRLRIQDDLIELRPENSMYQPIIVRPEDDLKIIGKVIGTRGLKQM